MASSLKSTLSSLFEASPSPAPTPSPSWRQPTDAGFSGGGGGGATAFAGAAGSPSAEDEPAVSTPSVLTRLSAKIPSFRDFLFDGPSPSQPQTPSLSSSRHSATAGGSGRYKLPSAATTNGAAPSESGATVRNFVSAPARPTPAPHCLYLLGWFIVFGVGCVFGWFFCCLGCWWSDWAVGQPPVVIDCRLVEVPL